MKKVSRSLTALVLLSAAAVANAQQTTLDFQDDIMSGTASISTNGCCLNTQNAPATGTLDVSIVLNGSLGANDLTVTSLNITVNGQSGLPGITSAILAENVSPYIYQQNSNTSWTLLAYGGILNYSPGLQLTTSNGTITGANISYESGGYHSPTYGVDIGGNGGADFSYSYPYGCAFQLRSCIFDMDVVSGSSPGHWTVTTTTAPEIDPASAASALTLLLGGLLVLRGRRRRL